MFSNEEIKTNLGLGYVAGAGKLLERPEPEETFKLIKESINRSNILKDKFDIVWGPCSFHVSLPEITTRDDDHVIYLAKSKGEGNDYRLVIRGAESSTNFIEGALFLGQADWADIDQSAQSGMKISFGIFIALKNIINSVNYYNEGKGTTIIQFIELLSGSQGDINITITGNSLGGGISTPLMIYLKNYFMNNVLGSKLNFHCCKFSAPALTDEDFSDYAFKIINSNEEDDNIYSSNYYSLRNKNDLVPCLWNPTDIYSFLPIYDDVSPLSTETKMLLSVSADLVSLLPEKKRYKQIYTNVLFENPLLSTSD